MNQTDPTMDPMPDIQGSPDRRNIAIDRVGVKNVRYPISLYSPATGGGQPTVANIDMYVALPHHQKGTHMSRFLEVLNEHHDALRTDDMSGVCRAIKERLEAEHAHLRLEFPYFIDKPAPVTGQVGKLDIEVVFECESNASDDFVMTLRVPATSLCPCSKEISEYGAHNQRCVMEASVRLGEGETMWIEDLFTIVERAASTQVFSVLKRPDEKWVTERAYENPKFVEDIVRDLAVALDADERIVWFRVNSENFESIHSHNAYAEIVKDKR
ncbi:MAG: GTP cyclohydrolase FolE2 [Planctomycetota bacterium]